MLFSVTVAWEQLTRAFMNMETDRVYFFDKMTGEIFFVGTDLDDSFWEQMDDYQERFLAIPPLERKDEHRILKDFIHTQNNPELQKLMEHALSGKPPYTKPADILSFFPEQEERLTELRDSFISNRVLSWLEENNLFSFSNSLSAVN
ncbi:MAG: UPF0158 family protein [Trichlorobacter sp.]|nr:UPF0158 family protein [Trichlorobacter sp.]